MLDDFDRAELLSDDDVLLVERSRPMVEKLCISLYPEDLAKLDVIAQTFCPKGITFPRSTRIKVAIQLAYERALVFQNAEKKDD